MGSSTRGTARIEAAMRHARDAGDPAGWIEAATALYGRSAGDRSAMRREIVEQFEALRAGFRSRIGRLQAASIADRVGGMLLRELLKQPRIVPEELFGIAEATKARTLLDQLAGHFRDPANDDVPALERQFMAFSPDEVLVDLAGQETRLTSRLPIAAQTRDANEQNARDRELRRVEELYAAEHTGFVEVAAPATLAEVRQLLRPEELLVKYIIPYHPLHPAHALGIMLATRDGVEILSLPFTGQESRGQFIGSISVDGRAPLDSSPLGNDVVMARVSLQRGDDARPYLRSLHHVLVEAVLESDLAAGRERWIVVPHGPLHAVPWMALQNRKGRRLMDDVAVTIAPSASVWRMLLRPMVFPRTCVAMGNPSAAYSGLPALHDAEIEVTIATERWGAAGFDCAVRTGLRASDSALCDLAPRAGILYFAAHGEFPEENALDLHRVLLARTRQDVGPVSADRVRRLGLRNNWCTVLSICDGGLYRVGPGDEPYGLLPAFLIAGARNVIAAQWQVDDRRGRELMTLVSAELAGHTPASALRDAMRRYAKAPGVSIRDWAPFTTIGSGRSAIWRAPNEQERVGGD